MPSQTGGVGNSRTAPLAWQNKQFPSIFSVIPYGMVPGVVGRRSTPAGTVGLGIVVVTGATVMTVATIVVIRGVTVTAGKVVTPPGRVIVTAGKVFTPPV